jgi:hypothetical protein
MDSARSQRPSEGPSVAEPNLPYEAFLQPQEGLKSSDCPKSTGDAFEPNPESTSVTGDRSLENGHPSAPQRQDDVRGGLNGFGKGETRTCLSSFQL